MADIVTETRVAIQALRNGVRPPKRSAWHRLKLWYYTRRFNKANDEYNAFAQKIDDMLSPLEKLYWALRKTNVTEEQFIQILDSSDALLSAAAGASIAKADKLPVPQA
jgi:hypothetical protein